MQLATLRKFYILQERCRCHLCGSILGHAHNTPSCCCICDPGVRRAYLPTSNISRIARSSRKSASRDEQKNLQPCKYRTRTRTCCCKIIVSLWITQLDTTKGKKQASSGSRSARSAITGQQVHNNTQSPATLHIPRACEK